MDPIDIKNLGKWLGGKLQGQKSVVAAFSGSYNSAVGVSLLQKSFPGIIHPVYVCAKDDTWRMELAEAWLRKIASRAPLEKVILNETMDDLEDQVSELGKIKSVVSARLVRVTLGLVASAYKCPIVWFGDRASVALSGMPSFDAPFLAPFSDFGYAQIHSVGSFLGISEDWLEKWDGVPPRWYANECLRRKKLDRLVGWVAAHREDLEDASSPEEWNSDVIGESGSTFRWMGWVPEDTSDRVILNEIVESIKKREALSSTSPSYLREGEILMGDACHLSLSGTPPEELSILGSVRVQADPSPQGDSKLLITGINEEGAKTLLPVQISSESLCAKLMKKLGDNSRMKLPVCFNSEEGTVWMLLSLSEKGMDTFKKGLDDILSYLSILPDKEE